MFLSPDTHLFICWLLDLTLKCSIYRVKLCKYKNSLSLLACNIKKPHFSCCVHFKCELIKRYPLFISCLFLKKLFKKAIMLFLFYFWSKIWEVNFWEWNIYPCILYQCIKMWSKFDSVTATSKMNKKNVKRAYLKLHSVYFRHNWDLHSSYSRNKSLENLGGSWQKSNKKWYWRKRCSQKSAYFYIHNLSIALMSLISLQIRQYFFKFIRHVSWNNSHHQL